MELTMKRVLEITGGKLLQQNEFAITGVSPLEDACESDLSFVQGPAFYGKARATRAGALLCPEPLPWFPGVQIVVKDPKLAMGAVLAVLEKERFSRAPGVSPAAMVHAGADLGKGVFVGAGAVVEEGARIGEGAVVHALACVLRGARVGEDTVVHAGAVIGEGVAVGSRCSIGPNSALGSAGFSVARVKDGRLESLAQVGGVVVEDEVEIGALCTVDRGTMRDTVIGRGTKMDNHCHVAHNARIGRHCLLVAYARIAGSTVFEDHVTVAEDVGVTDNVTIGAWARIGGGSRVYKDVAPREEVWGAPARPLAEERRIQASLRRLPDLRHKIKTLWRRVKPETPE